MEKESYMPRPYDTSEIAISENLISLTELLARNTHENWAKNRIAQGWKWGEKRDDSKKEHPCLVSYDDLPEEEKEYDRKTSTEVLKMLLSAGYVIHRQVDLI